MKKYIFISILFIFINRIDILCEPMDTVNGGYKKCIEYSYEIKDNKILYDKKDIKCICKYNAKGIEIERMSFYDNGNKFTKDIYQYNNDGQIIIKMSFDNFKLRWKEAYFYNEKNQLIEFEDYNLTSSIPKKEIYLYDSSGNNIEMKYFLTENNNYQNVKMKYNEKRLLTEKVYYNVYIDKEKIDEIYNYAYDKRDSIIEIIRSIPKDSIEIREKIIFDEKGRRVEYLWTRYQKNILESEYSSKETYKYDNKNNLIEHIRYNENNRVLRKTTFKFDNKGNETERIQYDDQDDLIFRYKMKYDKKNYLIEEVCYRENGQFDYKFVYGYDNFKNITEQKWYNEENELTEYSSYEYSK